MVPSPLLELFKRGEAARDVRLLAAQGGLGVRAHDQLAILEFRREVSREFYYAVGYQYERFHDSALGRDYRASPLLLELGLRRDFH